MAVNSVGSTSSAVQQQMLAAKPAQPELAGRPRESSDAARVSETRAKTVQQARVARAERADRTERPERTEQPGPVVNAQGQKIGNIINTTA